jgi:ribulose-phosphate 3-epimerase
MSSNIKISPSIIASKLTDMSSIIPRMDPHAIDLIHMDVMDGNFVPNITFGPDYIKEITRYTDIPLDIHLMIEKPELSIDRYIELKPGVISIHYESTRFPIRLLKLMREEGVKSGITINPATPVEAISDLLPYCDMVLVMSVEPGFYGQAFQNESIDRVRRIKENIVSMGLHTEIQVDGGVSLDNIAFLTEAGASIYVAGSAVFKGGDMNNNSLALKEAALGQ